MPCLLDYVKYCGILIILTFLLKYLIPNVGYVEAFIISLIFVTVFTVLTTKTMCKNSSEKFVNSVNRPIYSDNIQEYTDSNDVIVNKTVPNQQLNQQLINQIDKREKEAADKIKSNYEYDMKYTESHPFNTVPMGSNLYGYTFLPPENWFRPYEYPKEVYKYKETVVPVQDKSVEGLLGVDFTGPINKINMEYLSKSKQFASSN